MDPRHLSGGGGGVLVNGRGPSGLLSPEGVRTSATPSPGQGQGFGGGASARHEDRGLGVQGLVLLEVEDIPH